MIKMFISTLDAVFTVRSSYSSFVGLLFSSDSASSDRCAFLLLLAVVCVPFVNGVTCNSQNVTGLPYLFIGLVDLSLVDFRMFCSFWISFGSMFSDFIKSVLPFRSTTVIMFGLSSVVGLASTVVPGVGVMFLSLISFLRPLPYTGLIVVFSQSSSGGVGVSVLFSTFSSNTGVLHLPECSAVSMFSSCCSIVVNLPFFHSGSPLVAIGDSERFGLMVCLLFFMYYSVCVRYYSMFCSDNDHLWFVFVHTFKFVSILFSFKEKVRKFITHVFL